MKPGISYSHLVRIPWRHGDTISRVQPLIEWDEICTSAIEIFGLPGYRFITHPTEDYMDFMFKDEKDAILFNLKFL